MSIVVSSVTKQYLARQGWFTVLKDVDFTLAKGDRLGILGRNGSGKSTLIRLLGGVEAPTSGYIHADKDMRISWPLGFGGGFQGSLTGLDNLKFICRIYGEDYRKKRPFVEDFAELGRFFREPVKSYSSGMRARLAFGISMAIDFDCYLIDEVLAVGDQRFKDRCRNEMLEKKENKSLILVSHSMGSLKEYCNRFCVLTDGELTHFDSLDEAQKFHMAHIQREKE